jgi:hypothetical protein
MRKIRKWRYATRIKFVYRMLSSALHYGPGGPGRADPPGVSAGVLAYKILLFFFWGMARGCASASAHIRTPSGSCEKLEK